MLDKVLTVIVPSYNVEAYLPETIPTFLRNEVLSKVEVLIVNDGSKDRTAEIGKQFEKQYPDTVKLVNKENGGHGSTINKGIQLAKGKYVKVVDADDWVDPEEFVKYVNELENIDVDVILTPFIRVNIDTNQRERKDFDNIEPEKIYDVDEVLTTGKGEIQSKIKEMILKQMEEQDLGIQLVNITIQDSEPPTQEVMKSFKAVETAKQGKETALNNANKYRNEKLPEAEAEADQIIQDAEAQKQVRINEAEAEVARFNAMYEEYVKNPEITKKRMFYETMEDVLPGMKIVIDNGDGVQKVLPLDSFTGDSSENSTETLNTEPQSDQDTQDLNDSENE